MKDLKLNVNTHDLELDQHDLQLVSGIDRVRQKVKTELLFLFSEWYLDSRKGIRYFDTIQVKNPNLTVVNNMIKATILDIEEIQSISKYDSNFDTISRKLEVQFTAMTDFGELTETELI